MEQKEKNNAVKEFLKRFLESAKCSPEMIAYLNEVDEAVFLLKIGKIRLEG